MSERMRVYRKNNIEKVRVGARRSHVFRKYGLTYEQYLKMLEDQFHKCYICKEEFTDTKLPHVDHCHTTEQIRKILCRNCNAALGLVGENHCILLSMVNYILEHKNDKAE